MDKSHLDASSAEAWLASHLADATFISRNGKIYGKDSDAVITFADNQRVEVTEFGYAPQTYKGAYSLDSTGAISLKLSHYPATWPSMYLYTYEKTPFLMPTDRNPSFRMGGRVGAVESAEMAPYWPFRQGRL